MKRWGVAGPVRHRSVGRTRTELGFRTDKSFALEHAVLTLRGRTAWAHDFDADRSIAATFDGALSDTTSSYAGKVWCAMHGDCHGSYGHRG